MLCFTCFIKTGKIITNISSRPFFLPVLSSKISPSGLLTTRINCFLPFIVWHATHFLIGTFLCFIRPITYLKISYITIYFNCSKCSSYISVSPLCSASSISWSSNSSSGFTSINNPSVSSIVSLSIKRLSDSVSKPSSTEV